MSTRTIIAHGAHTAGHDADSGMRGFQDIWQQSLRQEKRPEGVDSKGAPEDFKAAGGETVVFGRCCDS